MIETITPPAPPVPPSMGMPVVFKRKFRFTFEGEWPAGSLKPIFAKVSARPEVGPEINYLSPEVAHLKSPYKYVTLTFIDVQNDELTELWKLIAHQYGLMDVNDPDPAKKVPPKETFGTGKIKMYNGLGQLMEDWELLECWFSKISFGELDFSSSDECTVELEVAYKDAKYTNHPLPPETSHPNIMF